MKVPRTNSLQVFVFSVISVAAISNSAIAAPRTDNHFSTNGSTTAEQIAAAQNKFSAVLAVVNRFSGDFKLGPDNAPDPNRIQLINNLMLADARGLDEVGTATSLQQAMSMAAAAVARKSNTVVVAAGSSSPGAVAAAAPNTDLVYTPITPCRIVDTRLAGGPLSALGTRTFNGAGNSSQGGGTCTAYTGTVPGALVMNVTADSLLLGSPSQSGFLSIYPAGISWPVTSWVNFAGGQIVANEGVSPINPTTGNFVAYTQNPTHVVVDVYGYFSAPNPPIGSMTFLSSMGAGTVTTLLSGVAGTVSLLPVSGSELASLPSISLLAGALNVPLGTSLVTVVQPFPQAGQFNTMKATFVPTLAVTLLGTETVTATLWTGTTIATLAPTSLSCSVTLPTLVIAGTPQYCTASTGSATVAAGDHGVIVISATATGLGGLLNSVTLGASVGIGP